MNYESTLWYRTAAENFDQALPVGNGRIGGMVYGNAERELIHLNEDSVWSGGLRSRNNPKSAESLPRIRRLLLEERIADAEKVLFDCMGASNQNCRHYMPLGNLYLDMMDPTRDTLGLPESYSDPEAITDYSRSLNLNTAVSTVTYRRGDISYTRETFVSHPDQVLVIHIAASQPHSISCKVRIDGRDDYYDDNIAVSSDTILYNGGCGSSTGIFFEGRMKMIPAGGSVSVFGTNLVAHACDEITILLSLRTSFYDTISGLPTGTYKTACVNDLNGACAKSYTALKEAHIQDYQSLYHRMNFTLTAPAEADLLKLPTNERLARLKEDPEASDVKLTELYFNFGRYLAISGSRPGTLPLNLQGIWNKDMWPAWGSKYTININLQMNYWPIELFHLGECHEPLFDLIERMRPNGRKTAWEMYRCRGFCAHHNTDLWGDCAPQDFWMPATIWPMGAAWLCLHIFEHYQFTQDTAFLAKRYDTLKEAALFFFDYLMEDSKGRLVTGPSVSPENTYKTASGSTGCVCIGPSMDSQIITVLFHDILAAADILSDAGYLEKTSEEESFLSELKRILQRLPQPEIGKYGQIKEWAEDYDELEPGHRHVSHLFSLYPADLISPAKTPALSAAARTTLERRLANGGGHTGWSRAWMINFWARLWDAEQVADNVRKLLSNSTNPNMFDSHPPFQIDGNFGGAAGIAEAIVQSHSGEIRFLPALPAIWGDGSMTGIMARGGFELCFSWADRSLSQAEILSHAGKPCRIVLPEGFTVVSNGIEVSGTLDGECFCFATTPGASYQLLRK